MAVRAASRFCDSARSSGQKKLRATRPKRGEKMTKEERIKRMKTALDIYKLKTGHNVSQENDGTLKNDHSGYKLELIEVFPGHFNVMELPR